MNDREFAYILMMDDWRESMVLDAMGTGFVEELEDQLDDMGYYDDAQGGV